MIRNKNLTILAIVAVLLLAWAMLLSTKEQSAPPVSTAPAYLIQGLDPSRIMTIVLGNETDNTTLVRNGDEFTVKEKSGYPAATDPINALITSCLDIRRDERITDNRDNFAELEISDETPKTFVRFQDGEGKDLTGIFIGKTNVDAGGSYVRQTGSDVVYVSRNVPYLRASASDYVDKKLTSVSQASITKVMVVDGDSSYTLRKDENNIVLDLVADGKQTKTSDMESVFNALENLEFSDVSRGIEGLDFLRTYICELTDSTVYKLKIAVKEDKTYITCSAVFTDQNQVSINPNAKDTPEELTTKETLLLARDAATAFDQKHTGWIYELASWQGDKLTKKRDDLLEDLPEIEIITDEAPETSN
jgi:hypothetical protein